MSNLSLLIVRVLFSDIHVHSEFGATFCLYNFFTKPVSEEKALWPFTFPS